MHGTWNGLKTSPAFVKIEHKGTSLQGSSDKRLPVQRKCRTHDNSQRILTQKQIGLLLLGRCCCSGRSHCGRLPRRGLRGWWLLLLLQHLLHGRRVHGRIGARVYRVPGVGGGLRSVTPGPSALLLHEHELLLLLLLMLLRVLVLESCLQPDGLLLRLHSLQHHVERRLL